METTGLQLQPITLDARHNEYEARDLTGVLVDACDAYDISLKGFAKSLYSRGYELASLDWDLVR